MKVKECRDVLGHLVHCSWSMIWGWGKWKQGDKCEKVSCIQLVEGFECHGRELEPHLQLEVTKYF